jgi:molybdopterin synthase catalytic subunit
MNPPASQSAGPDPCCRVALIDGPLDLESLWHEIADPDCGAHLVFVGRTRQRTGSRRTLDLCYEAYRPMAQRELQALAVAAAQRWPLAHVVIEHRLGRVGIGEASVAVAVSSPHRGAVMESIPWIMDRLKQTVPIWKQERDEEGAAAWVHPAADEPTSPAPTAPKSDSKSSP